MFDAVSSLFGGAAAMGNAAYGKKAAGKSAETHDTASVNEGLPPNVAAVQRIKEIGFSKWAEEVRAQKLEEMREEILASMGLSEADLAGMATGDRASIEQMIQQEIQERMAASSLTKDNAAGIATNQSGVQAQPFGQAGAANSPSAAGFAIGGAPGTGISMGPAAMTVLINAQEQSATQAQSRDAERGSVQSRFDPPPGRRAANFA